MTIKIDDLTPSLHDGWVAMNKYESWFWFNEKPIIKENIGLWVGVDRDCYNLSVDYDIEPAEDWKKSLIEVGGK